ncbi:MAG: Plug domain-containing protein, partial [Muribaculaceae bacterium]|nr:Plug domain-containing protein [Muribaculaceae bacterium]
MIVTAREGKTASTSSVIDTTAMQHLQPSSFSDLLELLPGGVTRDPNMGSVNTISLRQAAGMSNTDDNYLTQALGTSFVVDGVPVNTGSTLQTTTDTNHSGHSSIGSGV